MLGLVAAAVALLLLEGAASVTVFLWHARMNFWPPLHERAHTVYDPDLGWVGAKSKTAADLYGPGRTLTTNARGFRNEREFADAVPEGTTRVVCIGDSFTQGYGVGDADAWPAQLERLCPRVEAPNLGQAGYGVDQSALAYARDTRALAHQVVVAALIADDFSRVRRARMVAYGKPLLRVRDGKLAIENVPVPRTPYLSPLLTQNLRLLDSLRIVELARRVAAIFGPAPAEPPQTGEAESALVIEMVLGEFVRTANERGATPVLVLLPSLADTDPALLAPLPSFAQQALAKLDPGVLRFDLAAEFEAVPPAERGALFLFGPRASAAGVHYSETGNALVAQSVARRLEDAGLLPAGACPGIP